MIPQEIPLKNRAISFRLFLYKILYERSLITIPVNYLCTLCRYPCKVIINLNTHMGKMMETWVKKSDSQG